MDDSRTERGEEGRSGQGADGRSPDPPGTGAPGVPQGSIELASAPYIQFSAKVLEHARHPRNLARMHDADAHARCTGWCGEVVEMYLRADGDRITEASFHADGCISTLACADMVTTMVRGLGVAEAAAITPEQVVAALDGLPYAGEHCAELSVQTLRAAIADLPPLGRDRVDPADDPDGSR